jgi:hypothetical protein
VESAIVNGFKEGGMKAFDLKKSSIEYFFYATIFEIEW